LKVEYSSGCTTEEESLRQKRLTRREKEAKIGIPRPSRYGLKVERLREELAAAPKAERRPEEPPEELLKVEPQVKPVASLIEASVAKRANVGETFEGKGEITRFRDNESYGFITAGEKRVIFSRTLQGLEAARYDSLVAFTATMTENGWRATKITVVLR
jgi:hypothetical protein